jgi:DNA-binding winged helix-turn-helix (wHTH) protein
MEKPAPEVTPLRFGVFDIDVRAGALRKNGVRVKLQKQPFQLPLLLLNRQGEIVTREELHRALWPGRHTCDRSLDLFFGKQQGRLFNVPTSVR